MSDPIAMPSALPTPIAYPSRRSKEPNFFSGLASTVVGFAGLTAGEAATRGRYRQLRRINARGRRLVGATEEELCREIDLVKAKLRRSESISAVVRSFALIREISHRGLGLRHHNVQILGGLSILSGHIAEMDTGEGKTLTAALSAGTVAMGGTPVHMVTVNDYLARRDATDMGPIYEALGLKVGLIEHGMPPDARRAAYRCDIVFTSNKELAFDYLRDRMAIGPNTSNIRMKLRNIRRTDDANQGVVMRGLHFAIVDEADSVLVDEARTPLVISQQTDPGLESAEAGVKLALVEGLQEGADFELDRSERTVHLTKSGRETLERRSEHFDDLAFHSRIRREEAARQALSALYLFREGRDYLVQDDRVQIVDEHTGRIMEDRSWNSGLHQLIEYKESCTVTGRQSPVARISYQRFFGRYLRLAGMTGTASEVSIELNQIYGLKVRTVPPNIRPRRRELRMRVLNNDTRKWKVIARLADKEAKAGGAVLVGTRSVAASEEFSACLRERDVDHVVLNALQSAEEADIIREAGTSGRITVATNMAGRGVDILPSKEVLKRGGLLVILSEFHESARIDRQLFGRTGRQGARGRIRVVVSRRDELLQVFGTGIEKAAVYIRLLARWGFRRAQRRAEKLHSQSRRDLFRVDSTMGSLLSFAGENP